MLHTPFSICPFRDDEECEGTCIWKSIFVLCSDIQNFLSGAYRLCFIDQSRAVVIKVLHLDGDSARGRLRGHIYNDRWKVLHFE